MNDTAEYTAANSAPCTVAGAITVSQLVIDPGYTDKITIGTTLTVTNGGSQASGIIDGGTLTFQAGGANFDWSGGTRSGAAADKTVIQANATFQIVAPPDNAAAKVLDTATIQNSGTINWFNNNPDTVTLKNAAQIVNKPGSVFTDTSFQGNTHTIDTTDGTATQFNLQTDGVTPAQLTTLLGASLVFTTNFVNSGTVTTAGTLDLQGGSNSTGTFTVGNLKIKLSASTTNTLNGTTLNTNNTNASSTTTLYADVGATGSLTITGTVTVGCFLNETAAVGRNTGNLTVSGTLNITGQFDWGDGNWSGTGSVVIAANAKLHVTSGGTPSVSGSTLVNNGIVNWDPGITVSLNGTPSSSTFQNNGVMNVQSGSFYDTAEAITLSNSGTIVETGPGTFTFTNCSLDNAGTIQVNAGTLAVDFALTQNLRTIQNAASLVLGGGNVQTGTGLINTLGVISATAASSTIIGDLTNGDYVKFGTPTSVATLNVTGNFTQTQSGILFMKVGRNNVGTQSDVLNITGAANLGGILQLSQLGNNLNVGDSVAVLKYGSQTGKFVSANVPNGSGWQTAAQATEFDVNQPAMTAVGLVSSSNPVFSGQMVTFTATVTSEYTGTPTGTVTFYDGTTALDTETVDNTGEAQFTTYSLAAGTHSLTAVYSGDSNFVGSASAVLSQEVDQITTSVSLNSSSNPVYSGQMVTFTATVTPSYLYGATLTGTVSFYDGSTLLATQAVDNTGEAQFTTYSLAAGTHSITAVYSGDSNFVGSTSDALSQVVIQATTTISLASSLNPAGYGQSVTFTATVTPSYYGLPTGTVSFYDESTLLTTVTLDNTYEASFTISTLSMGTHSISAVYSGDDNFAGSTPDVFSQQITC